MSREVVPSSPAGRRTRAGRTDLLLLVAGTLLTLAGIAFFLAFAPADRTFLRFLAFVALPALIVAAFAVSRSERPNWLLLVVALLDLEAALLGEMPLIGLALTVAVPLIGVAFVTGLLPAERLRLPYVAAWVASTAGVAWAIATTSAPAGIASIPSWTAIPVFAVVDAAGLVVLWQMTRRRMFALRASTEAETRFRELLDGVDLLAADIGADGRIKWANEYGSRLLNVERSEVIGMPWYDMFVPDDRRAEAKRRLNEQVEGRYQIARRRESEVVTRTGDRRLIRWSHVVRHDPEGRFASLASIGEDITAARQAEDAFRRVSELNDALIASSPVPTAVIALDRTVQLWNPALAEMLGWPAAEVLGKPFPDVVPGGATRESMPQLFAEVAAGREVRGWPTRLKRRDGTVILIRIYATALRDAAGRPFAIAAQGIDVTAQEAMEARLRESQKMEAVGRLAGGVAHDFNNSLTAIGGFAALIAASTDDPEIRMEAESISAAVRRSANLTRELLAYARRSLLQPEPLEINAFVGSIRPMLRPLLGEDVRLVIESGVAEATVRVDPGQLEQALLNLAVNARDAMPDGGQVTIRTGRRTRAAPASGPGTAAGAARADAADATEAAATGEPDDRTWVTVSVTDTGCGIAPDIQSHVFDPFFTTKPVGVGTGLGLAMVQGFVAQSGGRVTLASDVNVGTTVEIWLPEIAAGSRAATPVPVPALSTAPGETILFVEDDPSVAAVGFQILSRRGYRVLLADSGATALALLCAHEAPIALVLADVILPDMRGPAVAEVAAVLHPEAAILFASGYSADTFVQRGEMREGVELIEKPYSPDQLALRVRAVIDRRQQARPPAG